jgi:pentatricopeptide repeat protein
MYCKCGALEKAHEVFEGLQERSVVSWNALIAGYVQHARGVAALSCFRRMQDEGISPDSVSFASILKACGSIGALEIGQWIHSQITDQGLLEDDIVLATALVDMYAKCGVLVRAREAFEQLPVRNVVVWSALIAGYVQHGHGDEAMECFRKMQDEGVYPNFVTFISVLKSCGIIGCLEVGESLHVKIKQQGLLENEIVLGNALVDMYAKCGSLKKAQEVFEMIPNQSVVAWNALICGQSQMGRARKVFELFDEMREKGILPDLISFLILLSACSHAGFVEEAQVIFDDMCHVYRLNPELEHMSCMVDLFGRAGRFDKLKGILTKLSNIDYLPLFAALLGACCKWVNVELGKWAFEKLVRLDGQRAASYVCMRNIYEAAGMDAEAVQLSLSAEETWQRK